MKIGFITAIREDHTKPFERVIKRYSTNLGPMYLAAYLEKTHPEVEVQIKDRLADFGQFNPDVLGVSSVTENFEYAKWLARKAKAKWGCLTVLGGVHLTSLPHTLPAEFDLGVIGEGEETFSQLVGLLKQKPLLQIDFSNFPGVVYRKAGKVIVNPKRSAIACLDDIPRPKREKFVQTMGMPYMMTSRGCPYNCSFCVIPNVTSGYRVHSPEYVVEEIKAIQNHFPEVKHIRFFDDLFIVQRGRVEKIAELIHAEGLDKKLSFSCWGRANLIDDAMVKTFKKMNMKYVAFGAESGSSRMMAQIKPGSSVELNQKAIDYLYDEGIHPACSILMGHPLEQEEDLRATHEFLTHNLAKLSQVELNVSIPWPGTALWQEGKKLGLVHDFMDFSILKEAAFFPNYNTEEFPYLNRNINPKRFMEIMGEFKTLYNVIYQRPGSNQVFTEMNPTGEAKYL
ncbi:MAG: radical SAM protein [Deltaproteobacteria bacterium]|nr:radical SAM protein [Deltaproteobacteria bacterium]